MMAQQKSAFQGERGGDAHDAELLALLKGISNKSSAADRFNGGDEEWDNHETEAAHAPETALAQVSDTAPAEAITKQQNGVEIFVAAPPPKRSIPAPSPKKVSPEKKEAPIAPRESPPATNMNSKSKFQGDRGGDAHDEELLALLRGISSSASDRFADGNNNDDDYERNDGGAAVPTSAPEPKVASPSKIPSLDRSPSKIPSPKKPSPSKIPSRKPRPARPSIAELRKRAQTNFKQSAFDDEMMVVAAKPKSPRQAAKAFQEIPAQPPKTEEMTESSQPLLSQEAIMGGGGNFKKKSTFQGERGGDAHDEELLALLRGVSAKSSAADRFSGGDEDDEIPTAEAPEPARKTKPKFEMVEEKKKVEKSVKSKDPMIDVVVAAKPPANIVEVSEEETPSRSQEATMGVGGNFKQTSTFQGERGGDAHDEELLALLRGVSAKSSAADRFSGGDDENENEPAPAPVAPSKPAPKEPTKKATETVDVVVVSKHPPESKAPTIESEEALLSKEAIMGGGGNFQKKSNFQGERGGDAHDEELLALLRGVSAKSSAADRFSGLDDNEDESEGITVAVPSKPKPPAPKPAPPKQQPKTEVDVVVAVKPKPESFSTATESEEVAQPLSKEVIMGGGGHFQQKSNFQGERGGDAHDEELLALLRGVSAKSSATDRFSGGDNDDTPAVENSPLQKPPATTPSSPPAKASSPVTSPPSSEKKKKRWKMTPPWKKKNKKQQDDNEGLDEDVVVVAPPRKKPQPKIPEAPPKEKISTEEVVEEQGPIEGGRGNFKKISTFQGERGGDAHDEELLALLRGVSAKSGDRFADKENVESNAPAPIPAAEEPQTDAPIEGGRGNFQRNSTFQGERGGDAHDEELLALLRGVSSKSSSRVAEKHTEDTQVKDPEPALAPAVEEKIQGGRGNFQQSSTFQGERGGDAHDEELLALLRGVSSSKASEPSEAAAAPPPPRLTARKPPAMQPTPTPFTPSSSSLPPPFPTGDAPPEVVVNLDDLPGAFSDKNWSVRKKAYECLKASILERTQKGEAPGSVDGNSIVTDLDTLIPTLFAEKNASALESAMQAGTEYANACRGATSEEQAVAMMNALIKGNGLSAPRPSAAKAATALVLKIMEVGDSAASLKSAVSILVEKGLPAKKPKLVQLSATLVLEAIHSFGAVQLPLSLINSSLPKVLTHSNKKIREAGMEILAELCRSFQSKDPLESVISKMQKAQVKDLDSLLAKRADPIPTKVGLRCQSKSGGGATCAADVFAALQADNEELEKERFAKRPAVKLMEEIAKTNYASELQEAKWSRKTGALDMVMKCAGQKPYKLAKPSSSNNYATLISDMKGLLKHTHFAVVSKAMGVLGMLAEGVGEKLFPNLRPLLPTLLKLSKDKKLTKAVLSCLDSCFGNVFSFEHLLDSDSSISTAVSESKEKNALARTSALDYLEHCVSRGESAGPRGALTPEYAKACGKLASEKLGDSDVNVRKSAMKILTSLQNVENDCVQSAVNHVVEELQKSNPRAYKTLSKTAGKPAATSSIPKAASPSPKKSSAQPSKSAPPSRARHGPSTKSAPPAPETSASTASNNTMASAVVTKPKPTSTQVTDTPDGEIPSYEEAMAHCATLGIPRWDVEPSGDEEDDGGPLPSMKSKRWQSRRAGVNELVGFVKTCPPFDDRSDLEKFTNCLLIVVKENTKKFKESNFNVAKCILELFSTFCELHERSQCRLASWVASDATSLAVDKIADRKLSSHSKALLLSLCVVHPPQSVIASGCSCAEKLRAPLAREEFLVWMKSFCNEFGAKTIGSNIKETVYFLLAECGNKNIKVKRAASATLGLMHVQLGPTIKALTLSSIKTPSMRDEIEKKFEENAFDASLASKEWPRSYIISNSKPDGDGSANEGSDMDIELPKTDLIAELPSDCITKMCSKDGKTAWKLRKAALEDVEKAIKNSSGLIDTSSLKPLVDLLRAMRERLSDTQSNLKPLAARVIGLVLGAVDGEAQGKLGKAVYGPIMNAAMNDKRKVMNDAATEALKKGTSIPEINGEGLNETSLEPFVVALVVELDKSEFKSVGIAGILNLTKSFAPFLPDLEKTPSQRGENVGDRFSKVLVNALSSSKSDIRSAAESVLSECIANNVFSMQTAKKSLGRMVPAKQRSVGMILAKISSSSSGPSDSREIKETSPSKPPRMSSKMAPPTERGSAKSTERQGVQNPKSTPRTTVPKSRLGISSKVSLDEANKPVVENTSNPLITNPSGLQKSRAAMRSLTWPEYPEDPSGAPLYNGLKKAWSYVIPSSSAKKLFPERGIRNQSDVNAAFDMLREAINMDKEDQGSVVVEQLHFILRWSVFVMGCKESAVGLTGLLDMLSDLISYLNARMHELSDPEVSLFVPFIYEKASVAKGRFKDTYMDLIESIKAENLISDKRLGPLVCVPLMESSSQAKARLLACQTCHHCVDVVGLSGIGKKGVLVAVKAFAIEKLPENRTAFLDLMVLLVSKMNNDINRFSKICGSSLTNKSRSLIEEHMQKTPSPAKASQPNTPSPRKASRPSLPSQLTPPTKLSFAPRSEYVAPSVFEDELPALDLRRALRERQSPASTPTNATGVRQSSFSSSVAQAPSITSSFSSNLATSSGESNLSGPPAKSVPSPLGAAASLRARLMKIREKNNMGPLPTKPSESIDIPMASSPVHPAAQHAEDFNEAPVFDLEDSILSEVLDSEPVLEVFLETIRKLVEKSHKIFESDDDLIASTDVLKNIHAAVSKQPNLAVMISPIVVENLREEIRERASEVVGTLTQLIHFGFHCHQESLSAGMSVPLLSVNLASLMAIFRSSDLATLVNVDDLTILIREAGTALLDPRLAQSAKPGDITLAQIDEATSTQMVRAINKLAVQAATGAARENSIQALIRLQDQLSSNSNMDEDSHFNSRLARVVTKLSTRVIKAEESSPHPFSSSSMDMETILCFLEDTLDACRTNLEQPEGSVATKHIVKSVVTAILKSRRECTSIRQEMEDLEIDPESSALGELVTSIAFDLGFIASKPHQNISESNDVGSLVSAVVSAAQGPERTVAIEALKSYRAIHGDKELMKHLEDVSPAFRSYLVKELSENGSNRSQQRSSTDEMSERIKNLRSKLNSSEIKISQGGRAQAPTNAHPSKTVEHQQRIKELRQKLNATQAALPASVAPDSSFSHAGDHKNNHVGGYSPSLGTNQSSSSNPSTVRAFRERLAAAKEKQAASKSSSSELASPMPTTSASSRAAVLRARLQAVKMQTQQ